MAVNSYLIITPYGGNGTAGGYGKALLSESQVANLPTKDLANEPIAPNTVFEIEDYSLDIEQTLNIGSQSSGAGAGKVKFNPFSITRKVDKASTILFQHCCAGTPFARVDLLLSKVGAPTSGDSAAAFFAQYTFKLAAVATMSWSQDDESPNETITFEYGDLQLRYEPQNPDGTFVKPPLVAGWNVIKNIQDVGTAPITG
jgi:type VI protein secretion system component Hcp